MIQEEFNIPRIVKIPLMRRKANLQNAKWILRNVAINNNQEHAYWAKSAVKDWMARNNINYNNFLKI